MFCANETAICFLMFLVLHCITVYMLTVVVQFAAKILWFRKLFSKNPKIEPDLHMFNIACLAIGHALSFWCWKFIFGYFGILFEIVGQLAIAMMLQFFDKNVFRV